MFEKVDTKEIKDIKERLEAELKDKYLPFQRKGWKSALADSAKTDWMMWVERLN